MSKVQSKLNIAQVGRVCVTVADTDRAIEFYVDTLGFEKVVDVPMGEDMRWVEVSVAGAPTTIALAPPPQGKPAGGSDTGICLDTSDVDADHAALKAAGVDVDAEVSRYGGPVPPMFWLRDPDGNSLIVVQPARRSATRLDRSVPGTPVPGTAPWDAAVGAPRSGAARSGPHTLENVGTADLHVIGIELKSS